MLPPVPPRIRVRRKMRVSTKQEGHGWQLGRRRAITIDIGGVASCLHSTVPGYTRFTFLVPPRKPQGELVEQFSLRKRASPLGPSGTRY